MIERSDLCDQSTELFFHGTYRGAKSVVPPDSIHMLNSAILGQVMGIRGKFRNKIKLPSDQSTGYFVNQQK